MSPVATLTVDRFWSYVAILGQASGCWDWTGTIDRNGYGLIGESCTRRMIRAHRFAYELLVGPIPDGMVTDHLCRNPSCVNPLHLEIVSPQENTRRGNGKSAIHARRDACSRGHRYADGEWNMRGSVRVCLACERLVGKERRDRNRAKRLDANPPAILATDVPGIVARYKRGERQDDIAASFGVSRRTISRIARGEWRVA